MPQIAELKQIDGQVWARVHLFSDAEIEKLRAGSSDVTNLRSFTYGIMVGIGMLAGTMLVVSWATGIKWEPAQVRLT